MSEGPALKHFYMIHRGGRSVTWVSSCQKPKTFSVRRMHKFTHECQKIAGCWECAVDSSRPPIVLAPGSSSPKRPVLDNTTSQPWSDATISCTTSWSAYSPLWSSFCLKRQSTRSGGTRASCARPWLTRNSLVLLSTPGRSGEDEPGFEAIRSREP